MGLDVPALRGALDNGAGKKVTHQVGRASVAQTIGCHTEDRLFDLSVPIHYGGWNEKSISIG